MKMRELKDTDKEDRDEVEHGWSSQQENRAVVAPLMHCLFPGFGSSSLLLFLSLHISSSIEVQCTYEYKTWKMFSCQIVCHVILLYY